MVDKDLVAKEKLEHSGLFDFGELYSFAFMWFKDNEYGVNEDKYSEKVKGDAKEVVIEWKAFKKLSDYFKIEHALKFEIKNMTEVEVEIEGKRKKMNKGDLTLEIKATLIKDPDSKWESPPFYRFWRDVYNKFIIPSRVNSMEIKTMEDARKFKDDLKAFLDLSGRRQ
jgi:hypothetical protein